MGSEALTDLRGQRDRKEEVSTRPERVVGGFVSLDVPNIFGHPIAWKINYHCRVGEIYLVKGCYIFQGFR